MISKTSIKLFITDVDGTLTDGGMYYTKDGEYMKKFNTRDAFGLRLLQDAGIHVAIITGEDSDIVRARAAKMGISKVFLGVPNKLPLVETLCSELNIGLNNVAYIGDDLYDLQVIQNVGLSFAVADAEPQIQSNAGITTLKNGGHGAVREAVNYVLNLKDS